MTNEERILKALALVGPTRELTLPQAAYNFLNEGIDGSDTERALAKALVRWADTLLGPEEEGNGHWADDGGSNL